MKRSPRAAPALAAVLIASLAPAGNAQSNVIPGTDVELGILGNIQTLGRQGPFPNGINGLAMSTTSCNPGSVNVPWLAPMQEDHPFISFLAVRESNGRMEQITDRSFVKHGFFALSSSQCTPCQNPSNGSFLGVGCSDTYSVGNNGDNFWLAPPEEIDPWLGEWKAKCSYFDMGNPPVAPAQQCDGVRSFTSAQAAALGSVGSRMRILDADLNVPGTFWYQGHYIIRGEPVADRFNNPASRRFIPTWSGSTWNTDEPGTQLDGSVLQRWSTLDAIDYASNGADDGFVWVAVDVTETAPGTWHYEYAIHNVDNNRGFDALRIPLAPNANVSNFGFHDVDDDGGNDWTASVQGNELVFSSATNVLPWNMIYNVWFDSDTGPLSSQVAVDQAGTGPGADSIALDSLAPLDGTPQIYCTPKPSSALCVNLILTSDRSNNPASGASDYSVDCFDVQGMKNGLLFGGVSGPAAIPFVGGTLCMNPPLKRGPIMNSGGASPSDCSGSFSQIVNDGQIVPNGLDAGAGNSGWYQFWYRDPNNGPGDLGTALSNAVKLDFQ